MFGNRTSEKFSVVNRPSRVVNQATKRPALRGTNPGKSGAAQTGRVCQAFPLCLFNPWLTGDDLPGDDSRWFFRTNRETEPQMRKTQETRTTSETHNVSVPSAANKTLNRK